MIRGFISGLTAMRAQILNQEVIGNNLANANTAGFQKDRVTFSSFHDALMYRLEQGCFPAPIGHHSGGTVLHEIETDRAAGPLQVTNNPLDIALGPGQYLAVGTEQGVRYTRRGDLSLSPDGFLTVGGYRVLSRSGNPISVDGSPTISRQGVVSVAGEGVDTLGVVTGGFSLIKEGDSLFRIGDPVACEPSITVGALQESSVDPVSEMVNLIAAMRAYEAAQKAVSAHDETLGHAVNRVGKV